MVVGGGFGGLNTAIRLTSLFWPKGKKPQVCSYAIRPCPDGAGGTAHALGMVGDQWPSTSLPHRRCHHLVEGIGRTWVPALQVTLADQSDRFCRTWVPALQVTLVDQSDRFVFKPLLYELVNGAATEREVAPPFEELLQPYPSIRFVQGKVEAAQPAALTPGGGSVTGGTVQVCGATAPACWPLGGSALEHARVVRTLASAAPPTSTPAAVCVTAPRACVCVAGGRRADAGVRLSGAGAGGAGEP